VEKFEQLDAGSLGIMGGSYGGYLTVWTISHDHRFKAAIVERGFGGSRKFYRILRYRLVFRRRIHRPDG
jgi:dipeptidyl aminopeptidase/acylaminoacyl peptidase